MTPAKGDRRTRHLLRDPVARNVRAVAAIEAGAEKDSRFTRLGDWVTRAAGTKWSIAAHLGWFALWAAVNARSPQPFDPFPYEKLTSIVSLEAIFLALFVLASQNRLTRDADRRAHLDLQVNLLAEQEMTTVLRILKALCARAHIDMKEVGVDEELLADTDIGAVAERVNEALPGAADAKPASGAE
jgi:uncharacterized membrane protein